MHAATSQRHAARLRAEALRGTEPEEQTWACAHVPHMGQTDHFRYGSAEAQRALEEWPHGAPRGVLRRLRAANDAVPALGFGFDSTATSSEVRILRPREQ